MEIMLLDTPKIYRYTITDSGVAPYLVTSNQISASTEPGTLNMGPAQGIIVSATLSISPMVPGINPIFESRMNASTRYYWFEDPGSRNNQCYKHDQCEVPWGTMSSKGSWVSSSLRHTRFWMVLHQPSPTTFCSANTVAKLSSQTQHEYHSVPCYPRCGQIIHGRWFRGRLGFPGIPWL